MLAYLFFAACLTAATIVIHAVGLAVSFLAVENNFPQRAIGFWVMTTIMICLALGLVGIHLIEIAIWALFFWWHGCFPDVETSFYFSGVTYATIGYGDVVLPKEWRLFGPLEGLVGIMMCGLSIAFFAAIVIRLNLIRRGRTTP